MTKFERIRQMRLDHGARCTEPPIEEEKIYFDWKMAKRAERVPIPTNTDTVSIYLSGDYCIAHQPG